MYELIATANGTETVVSTHATLAQADAAWHALYADGLGGYEDAWLRHHGRDMDSSYRDGGPAGPESWQYTD